MNPTLIARLLAGGRVAIGLALFLAPSSTGRRWFGEVADEPGATIATRATGARDVAIGVGSLAALESGHDATRWVEAGIIADVADATATLLARDHMDRATLGGVLAVAGGAALTGAWLRTRMGG